MGFLVVGDDEGLGGLPGLLGRLGDDEGDRPAHVVHPVLLEDGGGGVRRHAEQAGVVCLDARGVAVVQDGQYAGHGEDGLGVDRADPAAGDGGQHQPAVREVGEGDLARVAGRCR
ncbi:hypothetical protein SVIOM342S_08480 [Streptomyces violaceorubidus]